MTFCGPARDVLLSNQETEKWNFDTSHITILDNISYCCYDKREGIIFVAILFYYSVTQASFHHNSSLVSSHCVLK